MSGADYITGNDVSVLPVNSSNPVSPANGGTGFSSYTNGQILIGNTSTGLLSKATLTAGSNLTVTNGTGTISLGAPFASAGVIAKLIGANLQLTTDQAFTFTGTATKYLITSIIATNSSATPVLAAGGIYTAASKGGSAIVAAGQVYTALSAATVASPLTLGITNTAFSASTLFLSLTTGNAGACTCDIYVVGTVLA